MNAARDSAVTRESHPDGEPLQDGISPLIGLTMLVARVALRSLTRVTVDGAIEQIPKTGPLILAANHLSNADGVLVGGWLTQAMGRRIHWLGKREMVEWPILGRFENEDVGLKPVPRAVEMGLKLNSLDQRLFQIFQSRG